MNNKLHFVGAALLALSCGAASAVPLAVTTVRTNPGLFTTTGLCTVTFDVANPCAGTMYSSNVSSHIVTGSSGGQYAQPAGDATAYLTVGGRLSDPVVITLAVGANYFGFYAGSIDSYNSITFSGSNGTVTLNGNDPLFAGNNANGSQAGYFNVFTNNLFTTITLNSTQAAFETDNHAFGIASPVPEPESIALIGIGLLGLVAAQRRRTK